MAEPMSDAEYDDTVRLLKTVLPEDRWRRFWQAHRRRQSVLVKVRQLETALKTGRSQERHALERAAARGRRGEPCG